jgi:hypothetical protein
MNSVLQQQMMNALQQQDPQQPEAQPQQGVPLVKKTETKGDLSLGETSMISRLHKVL